MFHIDLKLLRHRCYDMIRCYGIKIRNLGNHVTDRVWELMKCLEKSLKNTCEGVFFKCFELEACRIYVTTLS